MNKYAQVLYGKAHHIFEHEETIAVLTRDYFSPEIMLVDITGNETVQEGWAYDNGIFIKPAPPTAEEVQNEKLMGLDMEYEPQFTKLSQALGMATLADNGGLIASIKADYTALKSAYDDKRSEIDG